MNIGQLAVKVAGKDAGKTVIVVDSVNDKFVIIDGQVKRKRCNIAHLEPLGREANLKKGATHSDVLDVFKKLNIEIKDGTKRKEEKTTGKIRRASSRKPTSAADKRTVK